MRDGRAMRVGVSLIEVSSIYCLFVCSERNVRMCCNKGELKRTRKEDEPAASALFDAVSVLTRSVCARSVASSSAIFSGGRSCVSVYRKTNKTGQHILGTRTEPEPKNKKKTGQHILGLGHPLRSSENNQTNRNEQTKTNERNKVETQNSKNAPGSQRNTSASPPSSA